MIRQYILSSIFIICISTLALSQTYSDQDQMIEKIVQKYMDSLGLAGMSVSVIQNDEINFKKSYGFANLELEAPMTDSSIYRIWSISKQFCAVSILKLDSEGLIKLNDPVHYYLDFIPQNWKNVTIKQLLNQTSGIKDYLNDFPEGRKLHSREFDEVSDSLAVLKFPPGSSWSYTNSGYWILSKIIEKVVGKSYQDYLKEAFFQPLQMTHTQKMDYFNIIKNRVNGYRNVKGVMKNSTRYLDENHLADGDGELISNIDDLSIWTKALFSGEVLELEYLEKAWDEAKYFEGSKINASSIIYYDENASYGIGWFISKLQGQKIVWTPGAGRGFSTTILSVPNSKLNIIVLCNARRFLIADKIAKEIAIAILNKN